MAPRIIVVLEMEEYGVVKLIKMETIKKVGISASVLVVLVLAFLGGVTLFNDGVYYCEARNLVMECNRLSKYYSLDNGKCWNSEVGNRLCRSGWTEIKNNIVIESGILQQKAKQYLCGQKNCTVLETS